MYDRAYARRKGDKSHYMGGFVYVSEIGTTLCAENVQGKAARLYWYFRTFRQSTVRH